MKDRRLSISIREEPCCASVLEAPLERDEAATLAATFAALADPARLRLLSLIAAQPGGQCACDLVEPLGKSQPTVSHHLKVLHEVGLVVREKRGTSVYYRLHRRSLVAISRVLR